MNLTLIAGARPNFMKIAPLVGPLKTAGFKLRLIHTGQHYDEKMSGAFFRDLGIPEPDVNLAVGSGSHVWQIAEVMKRLETDYQQARPQVVVVVGDVNSTLAAALAANKMGIPVAHVEAGLRSNDRNMPEELNRILTDAVSDWLFTSEPAGEANLRREGIGDDRIIPVGNVMIDSLLHHLPQARQLSAARQLGLERHEYAVMTLHRPSNVDVPAHLEAIMAAVHALSENVPIVFPIHPRTRSRLEQLDPGPTNGNGRLLLTEPVGYLEMLHLVDGARLVLTDSGGLQEEATALQVPCLTMRENTERPITIEQGSNQLVGCNGQAILSAGRAALAGPLRCGSVPELWDGHAADRIAKALQQRLASRRS